MNILPIDQKRREWTEVWLAFIGVAMTEIQFIEIQSIVYDRLQNLLIEIFQRFAEQDQLTLTPIQAAREI